jgi:dienelactone hydrolase
VIAVGLAGAALSIPVRIGLLTLFLLPHFFPGDVPRPLRLLAPAPAISTIDVPGAPGRMVADVYRPSTEGRYPAMVLLLGVNPLPRSHEQVTTLAEGIARTGIVTVVAESAALMAGDIKPEEVDNLVALFTYLERDPGVDPSRIGFAGFCVGAVLELLAASDPRIADRVAYVNASSVYADTVELLRSILSETMPTPEGRIRWTPDEVPRAVFVRHVVSAVPAAEDRALLQREFLEGGSPSSEESESLTALGRRLRQLLRARDVAEIDTLISELPQDFVRELRRLSPAASIHRLRARAFLMHDENDALLPVAGARQLAAALPPGGEYTEFRLFKHVVPAGVDDPVQFAGEILKLFGHIHRVLSVAHGGRGG